MGILSGVGHWLGWRPRPDEALRRDVDRAVERVDPLLKTVSGYERRLAPAVSHALGYCERLAAGVPGPVDINARAFGADPLVHALFASPDDIAEMLGKSRELRKFLADSENAGKQDLFALLGMRRGEKAVTGMAVHGDVVQTGVAQRLLYFTDHTLGKVCTDAKTARERLRAAAFDGLAKGFAACVEELREERQQARNAWNLEQASAGRIERRLVLEERQRQAIASLAPEHLLAAFAEWLAAPESRLYLKPAEVTVDRMGVMARETEAGGSFSTLSLPELVGRDRRNWIVVVARIAREDAQQALLRQDQANRYLII